MRRINLILEGEIPSKKNLLRTGRGHVYKDPRMVSFEKDAYYQFQPQVKGKGILRGRLSLNVIFFQKRDKDVDNMLSTLFDLIEQSGIIENDRQIQHLGHIVKFPPVNESKALIFLSSYQKNLLPLNILNIIKNHD